ncbi:MAG: polysaccharide biosynthesis tyrosine autokinase, partial [Ignavibacteriaceae bacterium]|nr:polysaccharide biosynthesis tyrosine autokinase [Ignavibacteriaceae bacterium]
VDPKIDISVKVKEYDDKIKDLRKKLDEKIKVLKAGIYASSPEEVKDLSRKIVDEELKSKSLRASITGLTAIVNKYEKRFNTLPKTSIDLARFQRNRESTEKLYILLEEKYQEALINEQSQPGNVLVIDNAREPNFPSKPNRILIILVGTILGFGLAFGYVFIKNYFDDTVKTPEDVQKNNVNVLAWIPEIEGLGINGTSSSEFVIARLPDSIPSEAFRALRTRINFSRPDISSLKTILVTSPAPREGKTTVALNLAGSFAQTNKKTLLVDCDLRKPRVHQLFGTKKAPGIIDYLFSSAKLEDVLRQTEIKNLSYITSGTIPPNPAEMLASHQLEEFFNEMKKIYDIIIIDSPPVVAVTDSEILSRKVDGTLLVVSSELTENDMLKRAVELLKNDNATLLGTVLNNFRYKSGYASYYKYYYYYAPKERAEGS